MDLSVVREEIRQSVRVIDWIGTNKRVDCPEPHCDGKGKKADCQPYENGWFCFVCKTRGDIFSWVMKTKNCSFIAAVRLLADHAGIALEPNPERSMYLERFLTESINWFNQHAACRKYLISQRHLDINTLREHQVGYCDLEGEVLEKTGLSQDILVGLGLLYPGPHGYINHLGGRFIFPVRNTKGQLISLKGRANPQDLPDLDPRRKSMPLKADGPWGRHSHMDHLYLENLLPTYKDYVFICEGEPDTLTLRSWGINALGLMTNTGLAKYAYRLNHLSRIYVLLDNDENSQRSLISELYNLQLKLPHITIYNVTLPAVEGLKKVDVNDYKIAGHTKQDLHKLATSSPEAAELIINTWHTHFGKDRTYSAKIYSLIRNLPDRRESLTELLSELTGVPQDTIAFAVDTCN